jgi:beta-galactosidase
VQGLVLYRRRIALPRGGRLGLDAVRDYATVFVGGRYVGHVSRMKHAQLRQEDWLDLPSAAGEVTLDILVDSFGHVGYGAFMTDRKGVVGPVTLDGQPLADWQVFPLPLDAAHLRAVAAAPYHSARAGRFFRATLALSCTGDSYLDMRAWDKGYVWVNGQLLGRYWHIGPQQRLFCPGCWLREGDNEVLVLDLHRTEAAPIAGAASLEA